MSKFGSARIERKKFWDRMRLYGYISGIVLLTILLLYVFFVSPLFKIKNISVESTSEIEIDKAAVITAVSEQIKIHSGLLPPDSYFAWNTSRTYTAPNVSSISIEKSLFGRSVTLKVEPRQRFAAWCSDAQAGSEAKPIRCFWVDQFGLLFEPAPVTEGQLVQAIYDDATDNQFVLGQQVLGQIGWNSVSKILRSDALKKIGIRSISLSRSLQELTATTNSGTKIIFSIRFDPQPSALPALLKFIENPGLSKLEYVNLTVENRAFVKYR